MSSLGWAGAVAVFVVIDIAALTGSDPQLGGVLWLALQAAVWSLLVPLAFASLLTGVVLALGTAWGLFRHYWVLFKLVLTLIATVVLVLYTQTISTVASMAVDPAMSSMDFPSALLHTGGGLVVLVVTTVLAIYKPRGMTRYGQRRGQTGRAVSRHFASTSASDRRVHAPSRIVPSGRPDRCATDMGYEVPSFISSEWINCRRSEEAFCSGGDRDDS
jgi:hypothetical protein